MSHDRECGACHACCIHLAFTGKPEHVPCDELHDGRCRVYDDRPEFCSRFLCGWIRDALWPAARPDRCGVLVQPVTDTRINVIECEPGALDRNRLIITACQHLGCQTVRARYLDGRVITFSRA